MGTFLYFVCAGLPSKPLWKAIVLVSGDPSRCGLQQQRACFRLASQASQQRSADVLCVVPFLALQLGDAALVRVALHAPTDGPVALGSVLAGTLDFRAAQEAAAANPSAPKCIQVQNPYPLNLSKWPPGSLEQGGPLSLTPCSATLLRLLGPSTKGWGLLPPALAAVGRAGRPAVSVALVLCAPFCLLRSLCLPLACVHQASSRTMWALVACLVTETISAPKTL